MHYLKQMKRLKYKITMARILLFAGFITLWEVSAYADWIEDFVFCHLGALRPIWHYK